MSTEAVSCPHCGVPAPVRTQPIAPHPSPSSEPVVKPSPSLRPLVFFLGVIVVLAILSGLGKTNGGGSGTPSAPDLLASVRFTGLEFVIRNQDRFPWTDCRFRLNGDYEYHAERLEANSTIEVGAFRFTTDKGERFQPLNLAAKEFSVRCMTPRGRAYYSGTWKD